MKQIMILYIASLFTASADARTITGKIALVNRAPKFTSVASSFSLKGDNMVFTQLPKKTMEFYVVGENGKTELSGSVNRRHNAVNISTLAQGRHTIVLKQGNDVRMFGYCTDVIIKG